MKNTNGEDKEEVKNPPISGNDWFLQKWVFDVNVNDQLTIPITLNVRGLVVTGDLIGGKKYFQGFKQALLDGMSTNDMDKESKEKLLSTLDKEYEELSNIYNYDKDKDIAEPNFIHLMNARVFHGSERPLPRMLWRGKIKSVDGFSLGKLEIG